MVIQGKWTKSSAIYPDALAREIAILYGEFIVGDRVSERDSSQSCAGLESPIINELLSGRQWRLEKEWRWKKPEHINMLEMRGLVALPKAQPSEARPGRSPFV